jgi:hypothetical protein
MEQITTLLKQNYAKLKDLYLSMTFGNRVVDAVLMAVLLFSLCYLIVGSIKQADPFSKTVYIFNGYEFDRIQQRAADSALEKPICGDILGLVTDCKFRQTNNIPLLPLLRMKTCLLPAVRLDKVQRMVLLRGKVSP